MMTDAPFAYAILPAGRPSAPPRESGIGAFGAGFVAAGAIALGLATAPGGAAGGRESAPAASSALPPPPPIPRPALEERAESPLPYADDDLKAVVAAPPAAAAAPRRERRELTSFDGTRSMSSGEAPPAPAERTAAPPAVRYAPTAWNNPLRWISIHID